MLKLALIPKQKFSSRNFSTSMLPEQKFSTNLAVLPQLSGATGRTGCAQTPWLNLLLQLCQGHFFINMKACSVYVGTSDFDRDVIEILGKKIRKADL